MSAIIRRRLPLATYLMLLLAAAGCTRGADEATLRSELQTKLDRDVQPGLFEIVSLRREGSAPLPAGESGASRVVVYFNTTLRLAKDYNFGGWDQLGPSSVAYALGATEKGVFGLQAENRPGDLVRAYGSAIYEETPEGWKPIGAQPTAAAAAPNIEGSGPSPRSKQFIDKLAAMVELPPPGVPPQQDEIIADELARASENIERRVKRREHMFTVASGPENGEYARFGTALVSAVNELAPNVKLRQRISRGSVENAWLLANGEADYAIVQGDVAAAAVAGDDEFKRGGPLDKLRAVGPLFPEVVHIVVRPDSGIRDVADLRGRRVDIGQRASGTRFDALGVLTAYGLKTTDLGEVSEDGPAAAITRLRRKELDAVFATAAAPTLPLQQLAAQGGLRLVPIAGDGMERLLEARPGLAPLRLPANTYPQQKEPVATVASAALLLTTIDAPVAEVERVTDLVFTRMKQRFAGSADVVKVSGTGATEFSLPIPLHPGAQRRPNP
jgi:TRAP transporter TAXI family solute receptor